MYRLLKALFKKIIPPSILIKNEQFIRRLSYRFYKGTSYDCNVCGAQLKSFIQLPSEDWLCPRCGSLPRTRRLWLLLKPELKTGINILHFSPSRVLYRLLKNHKDINYTSTDYENEFLADQKLDIRATGLTLDQFDIIICFHVLEHIDEDQTAMQELYRILKPGGRCYIQTPFKSGSIYEDDSIITPEERTKHFGQHDHVRIYSPNGLKERLDLAGFQTTIHKYEQENENRLGFKKEEFVLIAYKS